MSPCHCVTVTGAEQNKDGIWNIFGGKLDWGPEAIVRDDPNFHGKGNPSSGMHLSLAWRPLAPNIRLRLSWPIFSVLYPLTSADPPPGPLCNPGDLFHTAPNMAHAEGSHLFCSLTPLRSSGCSPVPAGDFFHAAPNVDHSQDFVRKDICEWLQWLRAEVGYDGWRLDFAR